MQYCIEIQQEYIIIVYPIVHCNGTNMLGIRTVSCLSHYPTAVSIDKLLSVSCSRPRGTNPFLFACVLAGNDVWWRWWSLKLRGGCQKVKSCRLHFLHPSPFSRFPMIIDYSMILPFASFSFISLSLPSLKFFLSLFSISISPLFSLDPGSRP